MKNRFFVVLYGLFLIRQMAHLTANQVDLHQTSKSLFLVNYVVINLGFILVGELVA
ncbi:hypothetical protein GCM10008094_35270 [Aidingimonas halophila]|nr:hypothetical protein GCM10008094_35270 [Aidingimonas halophila]